MRRWDWSKVLQKRTGLVTHSAGAGRIGQESLQEWKRLFRQDCLIWLTDCFCRSGWDWANFLQTQTGSAKFLEELFKQCWYIVQMFGQISFWKSWKNSPTDASSSKICSRLWFSADALMIQLRFRPECPFNHRAPPPLCTAYVNEWLVLWVTVWNIELFQLQNTKRFLAQFQILLWTACFFFFVCRVQLWWTGTWAEALCVKHTAVSWNKRNQHGDFLFFNPKVSLSVQKTHLRFPFFSESRIDF